MNCTPHLNFDGAITHGRCERHFQLQPQAGLLHLAVTGTAVERRPAGRRPKRPGLQCDCAAYNRPLKVSPGSVVHVLCVITYDSPTPVACKQSLPQKLQAGQEQAVPSSTPTITPGPRKTHKTCIPHTHTHHHYGKKYRASHAPYQC